MGVMLFEKIIVIDDDDRVIKSLKMALPDHEIIGFNNGLEALSFLDRPNNIRIVFLDVMMPKLDGMTVLERLRKFNKNIAVIMMTAYGSQDIVVQALRLHADDFIEKPFDIHDIREKVRGFLREKEGIFPSDRDQSEHVERIKRYLERNGSDASLEHVATELRMSTKYISRMFNKKSGSSFRDYKMNLKIDKAKQMLMSSSYSVVEISDKLGYLNPESFMRIFKRKTKFTPSEYRDQFLRKPHDHD